MRIPQISLFLENKAGRLIVPCKLLSDAGINIVTLSLAETQQFGVVRLIAREWRRAQEVLEAAGWVVDVTEVLAIEVPDKPGGMVELLGIFEQAGVNIEYMYAFTARQGILVFRFGNLDAAISALARAGINPVSPVNLYDHLDEE